MTLRIVTPSYLGKLQRHYIRALNALYAVMPYQYRMVSGISDIDKARELCLMDIDGVDMILWIDDDIGFGIPTIYKMVNSAAAADMVVCWYPKKLTKEKTRGLGLSLLRTSILQKLSTPFFQRDYTGGVIHGEDVSFIQRIARVGRVLDLVDECVIHERCI